MNEILDIYDAIGFHADELLRLDEISWETSIFEGYINPLTISNHYSMLAWLFNLVANKHTTSYQAYLDKCKELSIPHYENN